MDESYSDLEALYAKLPQLECKGDCADICKTVLVMSLKERARIEEAHGPVTCDAEGWCSMFENRRCKAHAIRPLICRLWGMTELMKCPYGCKPEPRYLTARESLAFLMYAEHVGGKGDYAQELANGNPEKLTIVIP